MRSFVLLPFLPIGAKAQCVMHYPRNWHTFWFWMRVNMPFGYLHVLKLNWTGSDAISLIFSFFVLLEARLPAKSPIWSSVSSLFWRNYRNKSVDQNPKILFFFWMWIPIWCRCRFFSGSTSLIKVPPHYFISSSLDSIHLTDWRLVLMARAECTIRSE